MYGIVAVVTGPELVNSKYSFLVFSQGYYYPDSNETSATSSSSLVRKLNTTIYL